MVVRLHLTVNKMVLLSIPTKRNEVFSFSRFGNKQNIFTPKFIFIYYVNLSNFNNVGGQDYGGGGYDANGQWQSRSIIENENALGNEPIITYVKPTIRYKNKDMKKLENVKISKAKSRKKRGLIDVLHNAYIYWSNKVMGINRRKHQNQNNSKYKIINGIKYVYYPIKNVNKIRIPKEITQNEVSNEQKAVIIDDFNKGEIIEGPFEGKMMKKLKNIKETSDMMENNPWQ